MVREYANLISKESEIRICVRLIGLKMSEARLDWILNGSFSRIGIGLIYDTGCEGLQMTSIVMQCVSNYFSMSCPNRLCTQSTRTRGLKIGRLHLVSG